MGRRIKVLDEKTVNKIAAGEVVESPSSVVKELLENSLDAGATEITVIVDGGGIEKIQVADNGSGMSREDAQVAFTRHSTSKIKDIDDLEILTTLGFRGEALASISSVSRVEVITREKGNEEQGTRVVVSDGRMMTIGSVGCPPGTSVTVSGLFENIPARKKFLKSKRVERSRCQDLASRIMLSNPDVSFRMIMDGDEKVSSRSGGLRERVAAVMGVRTARAMLPVSEKNCSGVVVRGLISLPWDTRSNSAGITISVSGRVIRNRDLVDVIRKGYGSRLMKGRFPLAVIDIEIPSGMTDVNVHPTKSLVKFSNETDVLRCLEERVSEAVFTPPGKKRSLEGKTSEPEIKPELQKERIPRQIPLMQGEIRAETPHPDQWSRIPKMEGIKRLPPVIPDEVSGLKMRVIGQLDRTYILCELGSDLILVDQHAAHERIRLETLTAKYGDKGGVQKLLEPIHLEMDRTSVERLMNNKDQLFSLGFDYEIFSGTDIVVRSLPTFMGRMEAKEVLQDLGTGNELHDGCTPPDREFLPGDLPVKERLLSLTACRGAIKAHEHLSLSQMEKLLKDLFECEIPLHCAHGRPTMIRLPLSALERWFKRVL